MSQPRDIAIFVGSLRTGGVEIAVSNAICSLPEEITKRCILLTLTDAGPPDPRASSINIPIESLHAKSGLSGIIRLRRWLDERNITTIYANAFQCIAVAALAVWWKSTRIIAVIHTFGTWKQSDYARLRPAVILERLACHRAQHVVYVSDTVRRLHVDKLSYPTENTHVISNIVGRGRSGVPRVRRDQKQQGRYRLISVGRLEPIKGISWVLQSARLRKVIDTHFEWHIVGAGSQQSYITELTSELPSVKILGHQEDVETLLLEADVFFMPSFSEGLSLALLEACRAGLPLLASDVGASAEVVRDGRNGWLFPPGSEEAVENALLEILKLQSLESFGRRSRELFESRFSPAKQGQILANLLID